MVPIPRKELYLNKIVGNDDYDIPEKPIIEEEFFFAEILGEAVQAPEPLPRYQIYLAKIAGRNIEIPYPETRLEYFLAKAAGMDIETPTPITREEIYWSNYAAIVEFEFEGVPPLTFNAVAGSLKNYRIFGNSVEQVISNNLFYKVISGAGMQTDGTIKSDSSYNMLFAKIIPGQDYIAAKGEVNSTALTYTLYNVYDHDPDIGSQALLPSWKSTAGTGIINYTGDTPVYLGLRVPASIAFPHLNIGTTICDYDEYETSITGVGDKVTDSQYLIPVTITNGADTQTTNLYLPEPLKMVGDEAEYIDYGEQKLHRVRKNLLPNTTTSREINGVTFTVNSDGSVICNGQALPSNADLVNQVFLLSSGTYILTGCPNGGTERETYKILLYINGAWKTNDKGSGANFTLTETSTVSVRITIYAGYTCDNLTFYPMIRKADIEDGTYEPYIENTDLDVTLPALPTLTGTNVLNVGTAVQPSKVYVKGTKEREYT